MRFELTDKLKKQLREINKKQPHLSKRIQKQLKTFQDNPRHPSLRTHKLSGTLENMRSISINKSLRMVYRIDKKSDEDVAVFSDIGTHDEVYKK